MCMKIAFCKRFVKMGFKIHFNLFGSCTIFSLKLFEFNIREGIKNIRMWWWGSFKFGPEAGSETLNLSKIYQLDLYPLKKSNNIQDSTRFGEENIDPPP